MLFYDIKVGYSCNNRCKHCVIDDSKDKLISNHEKIDLSTEECIRLIKKAAEAKADGVVLTGGEVSLRKDFNVLLNECVKNRLAITIQTNGRRFAEDKIFSLVSNVPSIKFVIALHGSKESTHDSITRVQGSFTETCKAIQKLTNAGKFVIVKVVISKLNMDELPNLLFLVSDLGVKHICLAFPHAQGAARKNFQDIVPRYADLKPLFESTIDIAKHNDINIEFETVPFCIIPKHMKLIGELKYLKGSSKFTQVKEETQDWNEVRHQIKKKVASCQRCAMFSICEGVWSEYIDSFGGKEFSPIAFNNREQHQRLTLAIDKFIDRENNDV